MKKLIILPFLLLAGCVSNPPPAAPSDLVSPTFTTAYANGKTLISWKADAGKTYTVYYTDASPGERPNWKPLPQGTGLRGTGQEITLLDEPPSGSARRYLLMTEDLQLY